MIKSGGFPLQAERTPVTRLFEFDTAPDTPRPRALRLELTVDDPDSVAALEELPDDAARETFARTALRIGVLALRQARGRIDADTVQREGERMIRSMGEMLDRHRLAVTDRVSQRLQEYFDPKDGRFSERVERLVRKDGELEEVLRRQIGGENSELQRTLESRLGENSPLMQWLSKDASRGLLAAMRESVDEKLSGQAESILREFSLDNRSGALARLVDELTERHGKIRDDLQGSMQEIVREFSLDHEGSALSRLVQRVEQAQKRISSEFSLDAESSALARMKRELVDVLRDHRLESERFRQEVREALAGMQVRREQAERTTLHGDAFEQALFARVQADAQRRGDVATHTGNTVGQIKNCKVGDTVIELGPDRAAAGARIAIEAKESSAYSLEKALAELDTARKNRRASVGLFVFSKKSAPEGLDPLQRLGADIVAVWDAEDPASDVVLQAALSLARALCTRAHATDEGAAADLAEIDRHVRSLEKQAAGLNEIENAGGSAKNAVERILRRAGLMRERMAKDIEALDRLFADLRERLDEVSGPS